MKKVRFPFPSSSLASWDTHKHTSKEQSRGNEIFLADILGTDSYCSTSFGLTGWHVASTMYTLTKNVFPGLCACVCVNSKEDKDIIDDALMGKILRSQQGATLSSSSILFAFATIAFHLLALCYMSPKKEEGKAILSQSKSTS